jgi:hypothetical protein
MRWISLCQSSHEENEFFESFIDGIRICRIPILTGCHKGTEKNGRCQIAGSFATNKHRKR